MFKVFLLMNPVYAALFWALVLNFQKNSSIPKSFLGKFMIVSFVLYLSHFLYFTGQLEVYFYMDSIYTLTSLLVYPLIHIYVRLLTIDKTFTISLHGKYLFLPFLLFVLHFAGYLVMDKNQAMHYLIHVLPGHSVEEGVSFYMLMIYQLFRIAFIVQAIVYLYFNYRLISRHNKRLMDFYSNMETRNLNWVLLFNFLLAIASFSSIALAILERGLFLEKNLGLLFPSLIFSTMLFMAGFLGNIQGETNWHNDAQKEKFSKNNPVHPGLKDKLDNLFEKEKIFANSDLKIWDLCSALGTNRTYVSRIINQEYGRNFCNHVNFYRVSHARKLIKENPELDNNDVAELSGFGSVNSLYRAFHFFEGKSLGEFKKMSGS